MLLGTTENNGFIFNVELTTKTQIAEKNLWTFIQLIKIEI